MKKIDDKNYLWAGLVGGLTAATCCIAPVVLVALGFGTAFSMMVMHQFHLLSILSGIILMVLVSLIIIKRKSGTCTIKTMRKNWMMVFFAITFMIVSWSAINYLIVAPVAEMVYARLPVHQKPIGNLKEMAEEMNMPKIADVTVVPENEGKKIIVLEIGGLYCGSCGPALVYDIKSVSGVINVEQSGTKMRVTYDSNITNKNVILANIHGPYSVKIENSPIFGW